MHIFKPLYLKGDLLPKLMISSLVRSLFPTCVDVGYLSKSKEIKGFLVLVKSPWRD